MYRPAKKEKCIMYILHIACIYVPYRLYLVRKRSMTNDYW